MFRSIFRINPISSVFSVWRNDTRSFNTRNLRRTLKRCLRLSTAKPPYFHIAQIGDPVLRAPSLPIEPQVIPLMQFKMVIEQMKEMMKLYNSFGLSAPQIGLPWKVFMIQVTAKHLKQTNESVRNSWGMELVPHQVFINPTIKTLDHRTLSFPESCESVRGFSAVVPRPKVIEVKAFNEEGNEFTATYKNWTARIVQHEMDHINGILYTDKMDRRTFTCSCWEDVNRYEGDVEIRFNP